MSGDGTKAPDPTDRAPLDARSLRGLAHPLRVRLLGLLRTEGASTATRLAEKLGLSSGATSYHLRQLATYGFAVEDESLRSGRERWWRAASESTRVEVSDSGPEAAEVTEAYLRAIAAMYAGQMRRATDEWSTLPRAWQAAQTLSDFPLRLTPKELTRLREELFEVIRRYRFDDPGRRAEAPCGSAPVTVQIQAFRGADGGGEETRR